jgi:hypothetical protein
LGRYHLRDSLEVIRKSRIKRICEHRGRDLTVHEDRPPANGSSHIQKTFQDVGHEDRALRAGTGAGKRVFMHFSEISSDLGTRKRDA